MEPYLRAARTTPDPIWAETPKLSAVGEKKGPSTRIHLGFSLNNLHLPGFWASGSSVGSAPCAVLRTEALTPHRRLVEATSAFRARSGERFLVEGEFLSRVSRSSSREVRV